MDLDKMMKLRLYLMISSFIICASSPAYASSRCSAVQLASVQKKISAAKYLFQQQTSLELLAEGGSRMPGVLGSFVLLMQVMTVHAEIPPGPKITRGASPVEAVVSSMTKDLATAMDAARLDKAKIGGENYDQAATMSIGSKLATSMQKCSPVGTATGKFHNVFVIDASGRVTKSHYTQNSPASICLDSELKGISFPRPPFAPFHLDLEMDVSA